MLSPTFFNRPLSIGDLLDWTLRIYRARFGKLVLTAAVLLVPLGLIGGLLTGETLTSSVGVLMSFLDNPATLNEDVLAELQRNSALANLYSLLLMPLSLLATGVVSLALTRQCIAALHHQEVSVAAGLGTGLRRFLPWLGMSLSMIVVFIGVMIVISIIAVIVIIILTLLAGGLFSLGESSEPSIALVFGALVGIACLYGAFIITFIGPIIYFGARWAVAGVGIVDQRWGPIESLQESWRLTRGQVRRTILFVILLVLLYAVIYGALMGVALGATALIAPSSNTAGAIIFAIISALLPMLWQPIQSAACVILYYDLRMRNQGYDLDLRIQQLEAEVGPGYEGR